MRPSTAPDIMCACSTSGRSRRQSATSEAAARAAPRRVSEALFQPDMTHAATLEQRHESAAAAREDDAVAVGGLLAGEIDRQVDVAAALAVVDEVQDRQGHPPLRR